MNQTISPLLYGGFMFKKVLMMSIMLIAANFAMAQETGETAPAEPKVTFFGSAQYRLRWEFKTETDSPSVEQTSTNFLNQIGYRLGAKVKANDEVNLLFEIGNKWSTTESVNDTALIGFTPYWSVAQAEWNNGTLRCAAGLLQLKGSSVMDLFAASVWGVPGMGIPRTYYLSSLSPWSVYTSSGLPGLRLGGQLADGDVKAGIDVTTSIVSERPVAAAIDSLYKKKNSAILFLVDVPVLLLDFMFAPQIYAIMNRNYRDDATVKEMSDMELGFGVDAGYKVNDMISARAGFGYAMLSNQNTRDTGVAASIFKYDNRGMEISAGATIKAGPGKGDIDFVLSIAEDKEDEATGTITAPYFDLKYALSLNKYFAVTPRLRIFMYSDTHENSFSNFRPELMFTGNF
jgi:hypothetical protein